MKTSLTTAASVLFLIAGFTLVGCNGGTGGGGTTSTGATTQSDSLSDDLGVKVPTQEEADAAAAKQITAENADEALKQLEAEADGGG